MRIESNNKNIEIKIEPPTVTRPESSTSQTTPVNANPQETYLAVNGYDNSGILRQGLENQIQMSAPTIEPPTITATSTNASTATIETPVVVASPILTDAPRDAQGLEFAVTKGASELAYWALKDEVYQFPDGSQWQVAQVHEDSGTGFRAILLKPLDPNDTRTVLSFAGTDPTNLMDLFTDFQQWGGMQIPTQYSYAAHLAGLYQDQYGGDLILTGHSLGGGLAAFASMQNGGIPTTTINPSTINGISLFTALFPNPELESNITNYVTPMDPISRLPLGITIGEDIAVEGGFETWNPIQKAIEDHKTLYVEPDVPFPEKVG